MRNTHFATGDLLMLVTMGNTHLARDDKLWRMPICWVGVSHDVTKRNTHPARVDDLLWSMESVEGSHQGQSLGRA